MTPSMMTGLAVALRGAGYGGIADQAEHAGKVLDDVYAENGRLRVENEQLRRLLGRVVPDTPMLVEERREMLGATTLVTACPVELEVRPGTDFFYCLENAGHDGPHRGDDDGLAFTWTSDDERSSDHRPAPSVGTPPDCTECDGVEGQHTRRNCPGAQHMAEHDATASLSESRARCYRCRLEAPDSTLEIVAGVGPRCEDREACKARQRASDTLRKPDPLTEAIDALHRGYYRLDRGDDRDVVARELEAERVRLAGLRANEVQPKEGCPCICGDYRCWGRHNNSLAPNGTSTGSAGRG